MKLLLDENLPKKLKYRFGILHEILTVPELGWEGIRNGDLLKLMQSKGLSVLISLDKNMSYQQNLQKYGISLIVMNVRDTRYPYLVELVPKIEELLDKKLKPGLFLIE
jgi:hypothetical protein